MVIAVDCLTEKSDLAGSLLHQLRNFPGDVGQAATSFRASRVRDDTEGAAIVAAPLYRDERGRCVFPRSRHIHVMFPGTKLGVGGSLPLPCPAEQLGKIAIG